MTGALVAVGDTYTAPDGVTYTLTSQPEPDRPCEPDTLGSVTAALPDPVVDEVSASRVCPWATGGLSRNGVGLLN